MWWSMFAQCHVKRYNIIYKYIMKCIVWIINDIHMEFNDIHWEGCLHITRRIRTQRKRGNPVSDLLRVL